MISKLLFNPVSLVIISALCLVFSFSLYNSAKKTKTSSQQLNVLEQEIEGLKTDVDTLAEASKTAEQSFSKEKIIRNELLMQKPGEYVVQIPDEPISASDSQVDTKETTPWQEWQEILQ